MERERDEEEPSDEGKARETTLFPVPSLFPVEGAQPSADNRPQWLCNPSFAVDVSKIADSGTVAAVSFDIRQERDEEMPLEPKKRPYEILESPPSYSSDSQDKRRRRKKKRRKRRNSHDLVEDTSRKSSVRAWASSGRKSEKDYYFDVRGDRDNLAFGSLYRMDVARFKRHDLNPSDLDILRSKSFIKCNMALELEGDIDGTGNKAKCEGRYYSIKYSALERHKQLKRIRILHSEKSFIVAEEYIPLCDLSSFEKSSNIGLQSDAEIQESLEDQIIRKTKEFNKITRDFPHDEKVWLAFADYQDQIVSMQSTKAARLQALDKKVSVLEKAVELNPDNEELLLCLMKAYGSKDSSSLLERWERILAQHPGSCKLWKEFLRACQSEFSRFRTSDMRKMYSHALQALSATSMKLCAQAHQSGKLPNTVPELVQIEQGLVDVFVNLCRFEWQTGHQELATGLFQAEIDYSLFCPSLLLSEQSKLRLFEHFWNGDGARIGEDGAIGWGEWVEKEEENRQKAKMLEESIIESEPGGWTGWTEIRPKNSGVGQGSPQLLENVLDEDGATEEHESDDIAQEDLSTLLAKLGIDVSTETDTDITDTGVWKKWSEEEALRDSEQWLPLRRKAEKDGEEQLSRVITFEDVGEYLFSLCSDDARFSLVSQFIDFFDGPIAQWTSTNSPSWIEKLRNSEIFSRPMRKDLEDVQELVHQNKSSSNIFRIDHISGIPRDANTRVSIIKFIQNAILLLMKVFPRNLILEEAVLKSDILFETRTSSLVNEVTPCRVLAKSLLKKDRQDLILCGVYAQCEAAFGCIDVGRKVFDMALSSMEGLPSELQVNGFLLYLWYAEMEVSNHSISGSRACLERAVYILSCLGSGAKYCISTCEISSTQLLRARQGFKEKIRTFRSNWARGEIKDYSIALVCSAALFEELTSGWASAKGVFDDAFSMVLPGRRSQSSQLESLFLYYIMMLKRNMKQVTLSKSWETILQGLDLYPYNSKIFAALIELGSIYTVPNKIRRILDNCCQKKSSVLVWIFSLLSELRNEGLQNRVHGLFEKALASDELQKSVMLWRCYLAYELHMDNPAAAKRVFFRAVHACPWSKKLWLDGFQKLSSFLTAKELANLQEVMRDKELNLRTDIYEILLQDET